MTDSMEENHDVRQETTHNPTRERDISPCETPTKNEEVAQSRGAEAVANGLSGRANESYASEAGSNTIPDLREVESWLMRQECGSPLFVRSSPTDSSHCRSKSPQATPSVLTKLSKEKDEVSNGRASRARDYWSPTNDRDKIASSNPIIISSSPPTTRESPKTSPVREDSPQPVEGRAVESESSTPDRKTSSDTTDSSSALESSYEPGVRRKMDRTNEPMTLRCLTPTSTSTEPSSSEDDSLPSETSSNSSAGEARSGCNAGDMSSPLRFAGVSRHTYRNLPASDPETNYPGLMQPFVPPPYMPDVTKEWATGYASVSAGLRAHSAGDEECSDYSDGTSRDSPDPLPTHSGPRPGDCTCDVCDDIVPFLERIRGEALSNRASRTCRAGSSRGSLS